MFGMRVFTLLIAIVTEVGHWGRVVSEIANPWTPRLFSLDKHRLALLFKLAAPQFDVSCPSCKSSSYTCTHENIALDIACLLVIAVPVIVQHLHGIWSKLLLGAYPLIRATGLSRSILS